LSYVITNVCLAVHVRRGWIKTKARMRSSPFVRLRTPFLVPGSLSHFRDLAGSPSPGCHQSCWMPARRLSPCPRYQLIC